ncbi:A-kinase anchor protein SPHKAP, partial [Tupaia chinensis]
SNLESPLMYEVSETQQGSSDSSGSGLGGAITACKKVLCSNSLLESTDYWLQNQRTPCQIGFVEDKSENCASGPSGNPRSWRKYSDSQSNEMSAKPYQACRSQGMERSLFLDPLHRGMVDKTH